ncbi:MAG: DUF885 domain-containing protein [Bacteroidia bacterium]|nr:DUF885 domain-containing protein [Bacteroidia bacterium]
MSRTIFIFFFGILCVVGLSQNEHLKKVYDDYNREYNTLNVPATELSYQANFANIQSKEELEEQEQFVKGYVDVLSKIEVLNLKQEDRILYKHLKYELSHHTQRLALEKEWKTSYKEVPLNGLHDLKNYKDWYTYYVKHFTSVEISPEQVFKMGAEEVKKAQGKISELRIKLAYKDEQSFYADLESARFFSSSKQEILEAFERIDNTVRKNLDKMFEPVMIPEIKAMEWPGADASTPPGIYLSKDENPYKVDVFQFNFSTGRYNLRCMDWLYMHEAIPGHHLQHSYRKSDNGYFYFGNVEGWACYIEDLGESMGLYTDPYKLLGKEEWNLVRSARLVMEVGIHYYGWTFEKAMSYWKENIKGQDQIAEREIKRITRWPGQSLCYKVGALTIQKIIAQKRKEGMSLQQAHTFLLEHSQFPLEALL